MLKVRALRININTTSGLYGVTIQFMNGLNIIRGNNSSGKSTIFQSILYGLGMEELIGNRNDKTMQSVFKYEVLNDERAKEADVLESSVLLEFENEYVVTTERFIKSESKDPRLIQVYYGNIVTGENGNVRSDSMYVHDAGSATDIKYGFYAFLEKFLKFDLPEVQYNDGSLRKLYLQTVFPSFVIEQKVGWSDFLATIPYYNLKDKERRAIEFLLNLDSWKIEEEKQNIKRLRKDLEDKWNEKIIKLKDLSKRAACEINGLEENPVILNNLNNAFLIYNNGTDSLLLTEYIKVLSKEYLHLEKAAVPKIEDIAKERELELKELNDRYNALSVQARGHENKKQTIIEGLDTIKARLVQIEEELVQNKHHLKVKSYGAEEDLKVAQEVCPTCNQSINDSLLPEGVIQLPMSIEDNIGYLESQRNLVRSYIKNHENDINRINQRLAVFDKSISDLRERIRAIKTDLVSDNRLPSIEAIERKIKLKNKIAFYERIQEEFEIILQELYPLSTEWEQVLIAENNIPKQSFSKLDYMKFGMLNENFIRLLKKFDYGSKSLEDLKISTDKLIPVVEGYLNIKFDSSASDLVRAIAAYTCSLFRVSSLTGGNHPKFMMFDEPGNQETANSTLRELFEELQNYDAQTLVFASFKQSEMDFKESTEGLHFNLIEAAGRKFIRRIIA